MKPTTVQLFATCIVETLRPEAGMAVVEVLERLGLAIEYPEGQTCCGQPAFNGGLWDDARAMARHTLDVLCRDVPPERLYEPAPIVVPSGSCADMIVHHYPELFADDPKYGPLAKDVASRTFEFSQFIVEAPGITDLGAHAEGKVVYHPSCHLLRGLGVDEAPRKLLSRVQGLEVVDLPGATECCGFGGLFALKMSDISGAMLNRKLDNVESSGAQCVVGCDVSCLLHIGGGLHRRGAKIETKHLAELLTNDER
ncbi:MAG TPA: (Fe-S)-binding protein [Anaerolineales bacterium]|nr:(Fe-S)-binding protein [Anaerolineales bacterium]